MANWDRARQGSQSEIDDDWDWYYYEYRWEPYTYGDRERYARDYGRGSGQDYGRNYGQNYGQNPNYGRGSEQDYGRSSGRGSQDYGRNYGRGGYGQNYGQDYERGYGQNYGRSFQGDYGSSGMGSSWNRGRYSGVGPRGYKRSDERIQEDINDRLTWHGQIDATDVMADVKNGVVTLSGSVNSRREKRIAEDIAESIPGVTDVQNNIRVNNQMGQNREESGTQAGQQSQNQETMEGTSRKRR